MCVRVLPGESKENNHTGELRPIHKHNRGSGPPDCPSMYFV